MGLDNSTSTGDCYEKAVLFGNVDFVSIGDYQFVRLCPVMGFWYTCQSDSWLD